MIADGMKAQKNERFPRTMAPARLLSCALALGLPAAAWAAAIEPDDLHTPSTPAWRARLEHARDPRDPRRLKKANPLADSKAAGGGGTLCTLNPSYCDGTFDGTVIDLEDATIMATISGTLPTELGLLTKLVDIDVESGPISGTLPTELGLLTNLDSLCARPAPNTSNLPDGRGFEE